MRNEFEYELTEADCAAAMRSNNGHLLRQARNIRHEAPVTALVLAIWIWLAITLLNERNGASLAALGALALIFFLIIVKAHLRARQVAAFMVKHSAIMKGARRLRIEDEGLRVMRPAGETLMRWHTFHAVHELDSQLLIYTDPISFVQISRAAFSGPEEQAEFLALLKSRSPALTQGKAADTHNVAAATPASEDRLLAGPWRLFVNNVEAGLKLAFFMRVDASALYFSWGQLLALLALGLGLAFATEVLYVGVEGYVYLGALPDYLFIAPTILCAWLLAGLGTRRNASLMLLALVAIDPIMIVATGANLLASHHLEDVGYSHWLMQVYYGVLTWYTLAAAVAAIRLLQIPSSRFPAALLVTIITLLLPLIYVDRDDWLWYPHQTSDESAAFMKHYHALTNEEAFYAQPALLEKTLSTLKPGRAGQVEVFFVGMAGTAYQDVFKKEVDSAAELFEQRFGTAGHSLKLVNNPASVADTPAASATALRASLKKIAALMNPGEDVLFLFMTSHGLPNEFSLNFGAMRFNEMSPGVLRSILDESGIKRRVVVISACYSGSFVDALKGDNTLVITAASPDRNSFGCGNNNDFTYFGKAYFDEALRETFSFSEAFEIARPRIEKREREENFAPSSPLMAVGKDIAPVLDAFAREREAALR